MDTDRGFLSAVAAVLFFTACAYVGAALFAPEEKPAPAPAPQEVREYAEITGIAVRREQLVCSPDPATGLRSGERVPCGAQLAAGVFAESSCVFFADSDGYEFLSPEALRGLTPGKLDEILRLPPGSVGTGRVVTGRAWYIAALSDRELPASGPYRLYIDGLGEYLSADLAEVSEENGRYVVLLRLTDGSPEALSLRKITGKIFL